jgi:hypothetical protein
MAIKQYAELECAVCLVHIFPMWDYEPYESLANAVKTIPICKCSNFRWLYVREYEIIAKEKKVPKPIVKKGSFGMVIDATPDYYRKEIKRCMLIPMTKDAIAKQIGWDKRRLDKFLRDNSLVYTAASIQIINKTKKPKRKFSLHPRWDFSDQNYNLDKNDRIITA